MESTEAGSRPASDGWFVVNVADAVGETRMDGARHRLLRERDDHPFPHFGINVTVLEDGVPNCLYHREGLQESFLVLDGEPLLLIEGEERRLRKWDFVHCPPGATHVFVGPGVILMVGARGPDDAAPLPSRMNWPRKYGASAAAAVGRCRRRRTPPPAGRATGVRFGCPGRRLDA